MFMSPLILKPEALATLDRLAFVEQVDAPAPVEGAKLFISEPLDCRLWIMRDDPILTRVGEGKGGGTVQYDCVGVIVWTKDIPFDHLDGLGWTLMGDVHLANTLADWLDLQNIGASALLMKRKLRLLLGEEV